MQDLSLDLLILVWIFNGSFIATCFSAVNLLMPDKIKIGKMELNLHLPIWIGYIITIALTILDIISLALSSSFLTLLTTNFGISGLTIPPLGHTLLPLFVVGIIGGALAFRFGHPGLVKSTVVICSAIILELSVSILFQTTPWKLWIPFPFLLQLYIFDVNQLLVLSNLFLPRSYGTEAVLISFLVILYIISQGIYSLQTYTKGHSLITKAKQRMNGITDLIQSKRSSQTLKYTTIQKRSKKWLLIPLMILGLVLILPFLVENGLVLLQMIVDMLEGR